MVGRDIGFGIHTINVVKFQKATYEIYTNETNTTAPVWKHKIGLKKIDKGRTVYYKKGIMNGKINGHNSLL